MYKILCVGPQWRGSDAAAFFKALSQNGHLIEIVDENYYLNLCNKTFINKVISKLSRGFDIKEFNRAILNAATKFKPDLVLIYKGHFVLPETMTELNKNKFILTNVYPDVSFHVHGPYLLKTLPLYKYIFTTKTFGIADLKEQLGINNTFFIPHGFDPDIHRPIDLSGVDTSYYNCDVSFIGGYCKKKANYLLAIKKKMPSVNLKIWGARWENCKEEALQSSTMHASIMGDLYILGILSSKINLGLLHEQVEGSSSGDKITSRTFHIPGAGGFMMHERTEEIVKYFEEKKEAVFFESEEELCSQISYYLHNEKEREEIRIMGNKKAWATHKFQHRANEYISILDKELNKN